MSSIVVLVILAILILGWLPRCTADSMNRVVEHREDKYSPSLHLVDERSGTRFCDTRQPLSEGVLMHSVQANAIEGSSAAPIADSTKAAKERAKVARVRQLRREAARRRAIIAATLLVITLVVLGISFPLNFSPLFALIPAVLLAVVVAFGVRTANHARAWERNLKAKREAEARTRAQARRSARQDSPQSVKQSDVTDQDTAKAPVSEDEQPTGMMAEQEIQQALRETKAEKERAEKRRAKHQSAQGRKGAEEKIAAQASVDVDSSSEKAEGASTARARADAQKADKASSSAKQRQRRPEDKDAEKSVKRTAQVSSKHTDAHRTDDAVSKAQKAQQAQANEPTDATHELEQVHPAPALDVVDLASNQDLISFSLGAPRNGVEVKSEEPKSLEIKSTRQVAEAKATTKSDAESTSAHSDSTSSVAEKTESDSKKVEAKTAKSSSSSRSHRTDAADSSLNKKSVKKSRRRAKAAAKKSSPVNDKSRAYASDPEKFHASELSADAEAPAVSSDSLGTGLEKILERRHV